MSGQWSNLENPVQIQNFESTKVFLYLLRLQQNHGEIRLAGFLEQFTEYPKLKDSYFGKTVLLGLPPWHVICCRETCNDKL